MLAGVGEGLAWLATVVDKEDDLGPDQSQSGPTKETVSPLERIVELAAHSGVGEDEHHQQETQDDP